MGEIKNKILCAIDMFKVNFCSKFEHEVLQGLNSIILAHAGHNMASYEQSSFKMVGLYLLLIIDFHTCSKVKQPIVVR